MSVGTWLVVGSLALAAAGGKEDRVAELLASANERYEQGDYAGAAGDYQRILDYGVDNELVHYNLGNARFKEGRLGEAILCYERALALAPQDEDAAENLAYAVSLTVDQVEVPEPSFPVRALQWAVHRTTPGEDALLLLLAVYLLGATATAGIFLRRRRRRPLLYLAAALLLMVIWSGGALAWKESRRAVSDRAVILVEKVDALSGPAMDYTPLFTVHEGLRVRARNRRGDWVQILLPNGLNGWVPAGSLGMV
jgi:tetratricopeptide (TPR) repeat protein